MAEPPPANISLRLRLLEPETTPFIEAVVLAVEPVGSTEFRVRLRFLEPCPGLFFKVAVLASLPFVES